MSITIPNKPVKFKELEKDFGTTICPALWRKAVQLMNYVNASIPIGKLMFIRAVQTGAVTPDPKYWKLCDGTAVSNAESPLNGVVVPDLRGRFMKHPGTGASYPTLAGNSTVNLQHRHGNYTFYTFNAGPVEADDSDEVWGSSIHRHEIFVPVDDTFVWSTPFNPAPLYHSFKVYIRIV